MEEIQYADIDLCKICRIPRCYCNYFKMHSGNQTTQETPQRSKSDLNSKSPILITVSYVKGNKLITNVQKLNVHGIDPKDFNSDLSQKFSTSSSVVKDEDELIVQLHGDFSYQIQNILQENYKIESHDIEIDIKPLKPIPELLSDSLPEAEEEIKPKSPNWKLKPNLVPSSKPENSKIQESKLDQNKPETIKRRELDYRLETIDDSWEKFKNYFLNHYCTLEQIPPHFENVEEYREIFLAFLMEEYKTLKQYRENMKCQFKLVFSLLHERKNERGKTIRLW